MIEHGDKPQPQKCILFRGSDGVLLYSTFTTALESEIIEKSMIQQGFMVICAMLVPDAIRLMQIETQMNINPSEFPRR